MTPSANNLPIPDMSENTTAKPSVAARPASDPGAKPSPAGNAAAKNAAPTPAAAKPVASGAKPASTDNVAAKNAAPRPAAAKPAASGAKPASTGNAAARSTTTSASSPAAARQLPPKNAHAVGAAPLSEGNLPFLPPADREHPLQQGYLQKITSFFRPQGLAIRLLLACVLLPTLIVFLYLSVFDSNI